jgi:hypothetical protein
MRKTTVLISVCLVALSVAPVFGSAQREARYFSDYRQAGSGAVVESLPERITRQSAAIGRGAKLLSPKELQLLQHKQEDDREELDSLQKPGK